ncbi:hypothetical protein NLI96_g11969 [Meripilus lineatus]|uniref:Uncharacterized protein n=1 Tax=Meripilus lineatus TaxID=2056292 RepID=A0AAD5YCV5_9APHY|nr:hypothetical protein NLI96_g11969 [Physisporinus lineatus]
MNTCRFHSAPEYATYSLDNLDFPLKFGAKASGADDCYKFICVENDPVKVWIIGEVQAVGFKKEGFNARRAAILINPFRDEDRLRMKDILCKLSFPPDQTEKDDIWIGKWMASRDTEAAAIPPFTDALDICSGVQGQPKFPISVLKKFDIVAVEALISRYTKDYKTWKEWRISLQLNRLFVLHSVDATQVKLDSQLF